MNLRRFSLLLLPLLLLLASGLGLGCFSETNDDHTIVALLRGVTAAAPVANLHLYFHGYAALWSLLYTAFPAVPWYGLTLYTLLYAATVLAFAVLERLLRPSISRSQWLLFVALFFGVAWLEHGFWFNYVRVPLLLAGMGVLFAAQRTSSRWAWALGLVAFGLAWLIRPSAAVLGLLAAAPGAWWLARWRALPVLGASASIALLGALLLNLTWSPVAATFRRLDVLKSNINDYQLYHLQPRTSTDSLALADVSHWMLSDSTLVNESLFQRAAPLDVPYFIQQTAPAKLSVLLRQLIRDYFPLLLALLVVAYQVARRPQQPHRPEFWLVQLGFAAALLVLGVGLKLPPRLALPVLDFWLLADLVFLFQPRASLGHSMRLLLLILGVAAVPYAYKTWHRRNVLLQEQKANTVQRGQLLQQTGMARLLITDAIEETYKSASPFADPVIGSSVRILSLRGWPTLDPSQAIFRKQLTGTRDFNQALPQLVALPGAAWLLTPQGAALLNRHLQLGHTGNGKLLQLVPKSGQTNSSNAFQVYVGKMK